VNTHNDQSNGGFSLVELLIGMSLALVVMTAVLSSYIFIGRSLVRLANQQTLSTRAQRAISLFARDVRNAGGISGTPTSSSLVLVLPTNTGSTTNVTWAYNSLTGTLTRTPASGSTLTLLPYLTTSSAGFSYYDASGNPFSNSALTAGSYVISIKQVSLSFTSQTGANNDGTRASQTVDLQTNSPRYVFRNQAFLQ
jgi:prepilin-type N-terminal cleavage/methylation domain-containing protein